MRWLAIEAGDAATWGSTVVTFGMACYAIAQGISQRRDLRRQNELQAEASQLQRRQIETAERRTLIMEDLLDRVSAAAWPAAPAPPPAWQPPDPVQAPEPSLQGASPQPPPPPAADEGPAEAAWDEDAEVPEDAAAADAEPQERAAPAVPPGQYGSSGPPGGYGSVQQPQPGAAPGGGAPVGAPWSGPPGPRPDGPSVPAQPPPYARKSRYRVPAPQPAPAGPWRIERVGRHTFALRNTGTRTLTGVRIGRANLPSYARGVPEDAVVRPGETTEFLMAAERGQPLPGTLAVSWDEQAGEVRVPVPHD